MSSTTSTWMFLTTRCLRPLDYDYLRELAPSEQRFYEIISYQILPALKYNQSRKACLFRLLHFVHAGSLRGFRPRKKTDVPGAAPAPPLRLYSRRGIRDHDGQRRQPGLGHALHSRPQSPQRAACFRVSRRECPQTPRSRATGAGRRRSNAGGRYCGGNRRSGRSGGKQTALALPLPDRMPARVAKNGSIFTAAPEAMEPMSESTGAIPAPPETDGHETYERETGEPEIVAEAETEADPSETPAMELARRFYETFHHNGTTARPTPRELAQAQDALDRLGLEGAQHLSPSRIGRRKRPVSPSRRSAEFCSTRGRQRRNPPKRCKSRARRSAAMPVKAIRRRFTGHIRRFSLVYSRRGVKRPSQRLTAHFLVYEQKMRKFWKDRAAKSEQSAEIFRDVRLARTARGTVPDLRPRQQTRRRSRFLGMGRSPTTRRRFGRSRYWVLGVG